MCVSGNKNVILIFKVINTQMCICDEEGTFVPVKMLQITPMCIVFVGESLPLF